MQRRYCHSRHYQVCGTFRKKVRVLTQERALTYLDFFLSAILQLALAVTARIDDPPSPPLRFALLLLPLVYLHFPPGANRELSPSSFSHLHAHHRGSLCHHSQSDNLLPTGLIQWKLYQGLSGQPGLGPAWVTTVLSLFCQWEMG